MSAWTGAPEAPELPADAVALAEATAALDRRSRVLAPAVDAVEKAWADLPQTYGAPETDSLVSAMSDAGSTISTAGGVLIGGASVLEAFAEELGALQFRCSLLAASADSLQRCVAEEDRAATAGDLAAEGASVREALAEAVQRARAALAALVEPTGPPPVRTGEGKVLGPRVPWKAVNAEFQSETAFLLLGALTSGDALLARRLLKQHPEWARLITEHQPAPVQMRKWWDSVDERTLRVLVNGAPDVVGALDGVPLAARVAANRVTAGARLREVASEKKRLDHDGGEGADDTSQAERRALADSFDNEEEYLRRVVAGEVNLVLYQREANRVVEMVGNLGPDTTTVITYVPGTFTRMESFYSEEAQKVAQWLTRQGDDTVAFVWKGADFPGDNAGPGPADQLRGLLEANEDDRADPTGSALARFEAGLQTEPGVRGKKTIGVGYSFGLVPVTASENAGAHYDQVHSLAGGYVAKGWQPAEGTDYQHWSYTDFLSEAQDADLVGGGRYPRRLPGFECHTFPRPGDFTLPIGVFLAPEGLPIGPDVHLTTTPEENHALIASDDPENLGVLQLIWEAITR